MSLLFVNQWLSDPVLQAICWTLIHSLWQGLLAAVLVALIITGTKRSSAGLRYNLLAGVFILFILTTVITCIHQLHEHHTFQAITAGKTSLENYDSFVVFTEKTNISENFLQNLSENFVVFFNRNAATIVLLWLMFFAIKCVQLFGGLRYIHRIQNNQTYQPADTWINKVQQMALKLGIHGQVVLLESGLLNVPVTVGFLKSIILVPAGLLSYLPSDQVESILLHELAHIRRKDYMVNLIQSFAESIFFFNPAIAWISSVIRQEREACCDDIVLAHLPHKKTYLEALVSFQGQSLAHHRYALEFAGQKNYLLNRVKRMLTLENKKLNSMEKAILITSITAITAFGFVVKKKDPVPPTLPLVVKTKVVAPVLKSEPDAKPVPAAISYSIRPKNIRRAHKDTVPDKQLIEKKVFPKINSSTNDDGRTKTYELDATDDTGKKYRIKKVNGVLTEFTVDGQPVPKEKADEIMLALQNAQELRTQKAREVQQRRLDEMHLKKEMQLKKMEIQKNRMEMQKEMQMTREMEMRHNELKKQHLKDERQMTEKRLRLNDSVQRLHSLYKRNVSPLIKVNRSSNDEINSIIYELSRHKLITDEKSLSFELDNNKLTVNGAKQPTNVHQELKEKYLHSAGDQFRYSRKGGTTNITINKD